MSNRVNTITVVLNQEMREDDCESIISAIKMIKGVLRADVNVADNLEYMAEWRAKTEIVKKLWEVLK